MTLLASILHYHPYKSSYKTYSGMKKKKWIKNHLNAQKNHSDIKYEIFNTSVFVSLHNIFFIIISSIASHLPQWTTPTSLSHCVSFHFFSLLFLCSHNEWMEYYGIYLNWSGRDHKYSLYFRGNKWIWVRW